MSQTWKPTMRMYRPGRMYRLLTTGIERDLDDPNSAMMARDLGNGRAIKWPDLRLLKQLLRELEDADDRHVRGLDLDLANRRAERYARPVPMWWLK